MTKLIKKIENADDFRNSISENESALKHSIVNNRIDNMIKVMKKMIFNVNAFMNEIAQQQKHQVRYFQLSSRNFFMQQMQIMRRSEKFNQHAFFFFEFEVNSLQSYSIETIFYQSNQSVVQQKSQSNFYKNNQFLNSEFNQRFSFQRTYDRFSSNKCLYCYRKNHVFKRNCSDFQNDMFNSRIHMYDKRIYLEF